MGFVAQDFIVQGLGSVHFRLKTLDLRSFLAKVEDFAQF